MLVGVGDKGRAYLDGDSKLVTKTLVNVRRIPHGIATSGAVHPGLRELRDDVLIGVMLEHRLARSASKVEAAHANVSLDKNGNSKRIQQLISTGSWCGK